MRKKDLASVRLLSRRQALQGMGAVLASAGACGDDDASVAGTGDSSSGTGSTGLAPTTSGPTSSSSGSSSGEGTSTSGDSDSSGGSDTSGSSGEPVDECSGDSGLTPAELLAEIDTIVVLVMENRSFDHYFGSATFLENWPINGLVGDESNLNLAGEAITVYATDKLEIPDPPHDWDPIHLTWNQGKMDGFVIQHELAHPDTYSDVMGYYTRSELPISYALAESYTLCDQWHCSLLGPTWPNRFYVHCASSNGGQTNFPEPGLESIWDVLAAQDPPITARNYYTDIPWVWGAFANPFVNYTDGIEEFFAAAEIGSLPQFVVIDPNFGLIDGGAGQNDDHPDASVMMGQILLAAVHEALAQGPQWSRCLLIITYDEHGGFYDHVAPPTTVDDLPAFQRLGIRVPSIVIGPHVRRGCVNNTLLEHVSIISTVTTRHALPPMNDRVSATADVSSCINAAYLDNPQPPASLPKLKARLADLLATNGPKHSHPELREMIAKGDLPIPAHRRHAGAGREIAMELIDRAQRLGVLTLID